MNKQKPEQTNKNPNKQTAPHPYPYFPRFGQKQFSPAGQHKLIHQYKAQPMFFLSPILPSTRDPTLQISKPQLPRAVLPIMAGGPG